MPTPENTRLLIVGNPDPVHVGAHLAASALPLGVSAELADARRAWAASRLVIKLSRWFRGRRPPHLRRFGREVLEACRRYRPTWLLATGIAPLEQWVLTEVGKLGTMRINYLTDDPWNPVHRARWFHAALPQYDAVFSPRRSNVEDLRKAACRQVEYLPFAYSPEMHFPEGPADPQERELLACDVLFVGGADRDRVPYVGALIAKGLRVGLYGGYWERYRTTRAFARGHAGPATLRKAASAAKVTLCLVRRANRDGHVMRTYEAAASGACMLVERTPEHEEIFGSDREAVCFFRDIPDMLAQCERLVTDEPLRRRLAEAAHRRITEGHNTYRDRLATMLGGWNGRRGALEPALPRLPST